jgi:uncharacterized membrane protein
LLFNKLRKIKIIYILKKKIEISVRNSITIIIIKTKISERSIKITKKVGINIFFSLLTNIYLHQFTNQDVLTNTPTEDDEESVIVVVVVVELVLSIVDTGFVINVFKI